jgi:hypothetical protein
MSLSHCEKLRLRLAYILSRPIVHSNSHNDDVSSPSTSDWESLKKEMERLRLETQVNSEAGAIAMARRRFVTFPVYQNCY